MNMNVATKDCRDGVIMEKNNRQGVSLETISLCFRIQLLVLQNLKSSRALWLHIKSAVYMCASVIVVVPQSQMFETEAGRTS